MEREKRTEVLVVGAGPVGMITALTLARGGVHVRIIDQASRTASRTYSCALHPRTVSLLESLGLAEEIVAAGQRVQQVAFYGGKTRQADADLTALQSPSGVVVLSQSALEQLLEERLR